MEERFVAGACGLKLHEDCGTASQAIDTCLNVASRVDAVRHLFPRAICYASGEL